jgi:hypothetical protein
MIVTGQFMTIVTWTIGGASWTLDFPHSLAPLTLIGGTLGAARQLARCKPPGRSHHD